MIVIHTVENATVPIQFLEGQKIYHLEWDELPRRVKFHLKCMRPFKLGLMYWVLSVRMVI